MKTRPSLPHGLGALLVAAVLPLFSGCAHTDQAPVPGPDGKVVIVEADKVVRTGSHIPTLVPRSPTARVEPPMAPLVVLTPDDLRRLAPRLMH
jgi:hypothetical protein